MNIIVIIYFLSYPLCLIHIRKGNWSHVGSIPSERTNSLSVVESYFNGFNDYILSMIVLVNFFGMAAQMVDGHRSVKPAL